MLFWRCAVWDVSQHPLARAASERRKTGVSTRIRVPPRLPGAMEKPTPVLAAMVTVEAPTTVPIRPGGSGGYHYGGWQAAQTDMPDALDR